MQNPTYHRGSFLDELVVTRPVYGRRSFYTEPDRAELLDAAHERPCGHLEVEACRCPGQR